MTNRVPRFETHIRPMMRRHDREAMLLRGLDLWDYDAVCANAEKILDRVSLGLTGSPHTMPPVNASGPWPDEWIALFGRWVALGCPRLELGDADYTLVRVSPMHLELTASGPAGSDVSWLEWHPTPTETFEFILYREKRVHAMLLEPQTFTSRLSFMCQSQTVVAEDAQGRHVVMVSNP